MGRDRDHTTTLDRNKTAAPSGAAASAAALPGTAEAAAVAAGKAGDIPFAPEGVNRWVGWRRRKRPQYFFVAHSQIPLWPQIPYH